MSSNLIVGTKLNIMLEYIINYCKRNKIKLVIDNSPNKKKIDRIKKRIPILKQRESGWMKSLS